MTRGRRDGQARAAARGAAIASRLRTALRATGVAAIFTLSAFAGFGADPIATRPTETAAGFAPRPYAMAYAVREAVAQARADRQFAGVVDALEASREPAPVPVVAYGETDRTDALDRFDAFVGGTLASARDTPGPVPFMRPVGPKPTSP